MEAITQLKRAAEIRKQITALYKEYHAYTRLVQKVSNGKLTHFDMKRAVDAIHYFGGGWPYPNSKGRMEALLDAFAGMYKILDFIGHGSMVRRHLSKLGVKVELTKSGQHANVPIESGHAQFLATKFKLKKPATLSELVEQVIEHCDGLQGTICQLSDQISEGIRPSVKEELAIDDPEYRRLEDVMRLKMGTEKAEQRIPSRIKKVEESIDGFTTASKEIKKIHRVRSERKPK